MAHPEMQEHGQWLIHPCGVDLKRLGKRPLESYNKTWLGFIAVAVVAVVIGAMLLVHALGAGYRHYTAEFLQAASLRAGNPITVAGIPVGTVTSMKLVGDHVEAGLKIRDDIVLGKDSKASIKVATILGSRYLAVEPDGSGSLPHDTFDLSHTEVPYDLQAALKDATTTFEQVDSDQVRPIAFRARQATRGAALGGTAGNGEHRLAVVDHRATARSTGPAPQKHRAGHQHVAPPAGRHRQPGQPGAGPDRPIRRAACRFPRDDAIPHESGRHPEQDPRQRPARRWMRCSKTCASSPA